VSSTQIVQILAIKSSHLRRNEFNIPIFGNGRNYSIQFEISNNTPIFDSILNEKNTIRTALSECGYNVVFILFTCRVIGIDNTGL